MVRPGQRGIVAGAAVAAGRSHANEAKTAARKLAAILADVFIRPPVGDRPLYTESLRAAWTGDGRSLEVLRKLSRREFQPSRRTRDTRRSLPGRPRRRVSSGAHR